MVTLDNSKIYPCDMCEYYGTEPIGSTGTEAFCTLHHCGLPYGIFQRINLKFIHGNDCFYPAEEYEYMFG